METRFSLSYDAAAAGTAVVVLLSTAGVGAITVLLTFLKVIFLARLTGAYLGVSYYANALALVSVNKASSGGLFGPVSSTTSSKLSAESTSTMISDLIYLI